MDLKLRELGDISIFIKVNNIHRVPLGHCRELLWDIAGGHLPKDILNLFFCIILSTLIVELQWNLAIPKTLGATIPLYRGFFKEITIFVYHLFLNIVFTI